MSSHSEATQSLHCLIVHTPKMNNYYRPLGDFMWINYMPMGTLAIADWLDRHAASLPLVASSSL